MAFKQNIIQRLFNICSNKLSNQTLKTSSSSAFQSIIPQNLYKSSPDPGDNSIFRRFLPNMLRPVGGEKLLERLQTDGQLTEIDAKKIVRVSQMEALKLKLRSSPKSHVSYDEFIRTCVDECCNRDQGVDLAKVMDMSGCVIVLGNIVFLKPEQVVKAINELMTGDNLPRRELKEMERRKSEIDDKVAKMVRRELWGGLGYLVVQTAAFMRLTFWELSWDVMEPICFYVTSLYFMIGYAYFISTSKEPSYEVVFESRFRVKQLKMMKMEGFDVNKYNELKKICRSDNQSWRMEGL